MPLKVGAYLQSTTCMGLKESSLQLHKVPLHIQAVQAEGPLHACDSPYSLSRQKRQSRHNLALQLQQRATPRHLVIAQGVFC